MYEVLRGTVENRPDCPDQRRPGIKMKIVESAVADQASLVKMMMTEVEGSSLS